MQKIDMIKAHLADNTGDENISKLIWIVIVFVVGAILLTLVTTAFGGKISEWFNGLIDSWFANGNGAYQAYAPTAPSNPT